MYQDSIPNHGSPNIPLFFATFLIYLPLICIGMFGFSFGMQGITHFYGFGAIFAFSVLIWPYTLFVLVCLKYQISSAKKLSNESRCTRIAAIAVTAVTVLGFISVIPISNSILRSDARQDLDLIRQYLGGKFGEEFASGIRMEADNSRGDKYQRCYKVYTDALPSDKYFTVNNDMPGISVYVDDFLQTFNSENPTFEDDLIQYLRKKYGIPDDMEIQKLTIHSIDFNDYHNGDGIEGLFERTDCSIDIISMNVDSYSEKNIKDSISRVWEDVYPKIEEKIDRLLIIELSCDYRAFWIEIYRDDAGKYVAEMKDNSGFEDTAKYDGMIIELK